jgi:hypothetical protein
VICQVQNYDDAELAVAAGADVLVAQGTEAGGHTGTMSLLPFLAGVVDRYPDVPVLAAGGIADGRTLAAALTAGADGAWRANSDGGWRSNHRLTTRDRSRGISDKLPANDFSFRGRRKRRVKFF